MKKLSKIFAVALALVMILSMLPMGAAAAEEKYIELTVDSLGVEEDAYADGNGTVGGVAIAWQHVGNYGDGLQMRDKIAEGKGTSAMWNTAAFAGGITKIELTYSDTKDTYDNPNCMIWNFGDAEKDADYSTTLSTTKGTKTYTITPDATTYTYFYLEWDYSYSSYWKSIKVYYNEVAGDNNDNNDNNNNDNNNNDNNNNDNNNDNTNQNPDDAGDNTAIVAMTSVMVVAVVALAVLVIGKKRMF